MTLQAIERFKLTREQLQASEQLRSRRTIYYLIPGTLVLQTVFTFPSPPQRTLKTVRFFSASTSFLQTLQHHRFDPLRCSTDVNASSAPSTVVTPFGSSNERSRNCSYLSLLCPQFLHFSWKFFQGWGGGLCCHRFLHAPRARAHRANRQARGVRGIR